jgi:hypothetical protein
VLNTAYSKVSPVIEHKNNKRVTGLLPLSAGAYVDVYAGAYAGDYFLPSSLKLYSI